MQVCVCVFVQVCVYIYVCVCRRVYVFRCAGVCLFVCVLIVQLYYYLKFEIPIIFFSYRIQIVEPGGIGNIIQFQIQTFCSTEQLDLELEAPIPIPLPNFIIPNRALANFTAYPDVRCKS